MKFKLPCYNWSLNPNMIIDGGAVWLNNLAQTLRSLGHEAELVALDGDWSSDTIIIQSEWTGRDEYRKYQGKKIVLLGHFKAGVYPDPFTLDADMYLSTWKGQVIEDFEKRTGKQVIWFPHAFNNLMDDGKVTDMGEVVFVGNSYALRNEGWADGLNVARPVVLPDQCPGIYRGAKVCINFHGDFQKGIVSTDPSALSDLPGFAVNERLFQITGCGGFQIADNNPQIREFFEEDELVTASNQAEFQDKVRYFLAHPEERQQYIEKGQARVLKEHTYTHRLNDLLKQI